MLRTTLISTILIVLAIEGNLAFTQTTTPVQSTAAWVTTVSSSSSASSVHKQLLLPLYNNNNNNNNRRITGIYARYGSDDENEHSNATPRRSFRTRLSEWRTKTLQQQRRRSRKVVATAAAAFSLNLLRFGNVPPPALAAVSVRTRAPLVQQKVKVHHRQRRHNNKQQEHELGNSSGTAVRQKQKQTTFAKTAVAVVAGSGAVLFKNVRKHQRLQEKSSSTPLSGEDASKAAREEQFNEIIGASNNKEEEVTQESVCAEEKSSSILASVVMNGEKQEASSFSGDEAVAASNSKSVFYEEVIEEPVVTTTLPSSVPSPVSGNAIFDVEGTMLKSFPGISTSYGDLMQQLESIEKDLEEIEEELAEIDTEEDDSNGEEAVDVDADASSEITEGEAIVSERILNRQDVAEEEEQDGDLEITKSETASAILTVGALGLASTFVSLTETIMLIPAVFIGAKALTDDYLSRKDDAEN
mmetsp:Transcript_15926/g.24793  ORF Transcript_15926/g.24793 Transcript_15926/m.24793 type:complete len:471 (-) Transcript_15926:54-1466(-)